MLCLAPVRTVVLDHHAIDVAGVTAVLRRHPERVALVPPADPDVEVVLYGARVQGPSHDVGLHRLLRSTTATVIVLGWRLDSPQVSGAVDCGAHGQLSKTMSGDQLVAGIEQINGTRDRLRELPEECHAALRDAGLTPRELEVLSLITVGHTNQEIADRAFLSINSVKTYVRTAYRKIGVTRRSQAVSWGIRAGLAPERELV